MRGSRTSASATAIHKGFILPLWTAALMALWGAIGCERPKEDNPILKPDTAMVRRDSLEVDSLYASAKSLYDSAKFPEALPNLRAADAILAQIPPTSQGITSAKIAYLRGMIAQRQSLLLTAVAEFRKCQAAALKAVTTDSLRQAQLFKARIALANQCSQLGMMDSASFYAKAAIRGLSLQPKPLPQNLSIALMTLGVVSQESGDTTSDRSGFFNTADSCFREVLRIRLNTPDMAPARIGNAHLNLGDLHRAWGHADTALRHLIQAQKYYDLGGNGSAEGQAACAMALSRLHLAQSRNALAMNSLRLARASLNKAYPGAHRERGKLLLYQGDLNLALGEAELALEDYHASLGQFIQGFRQRPRNLNPEVWELGREWYVTEAIAGKGRAYAMMQNQDGLDSALHCYIDAVRYADHLRRNFGTLEEKVHLAEATLPVTERALDLAVRKYQGSGDTFGIAAVFELMERAKANDLLDALNQVQASGEYAIPDSIWLKGRALSMSLDSTRAVIQSGDRQGISHLLKLQDDSLALQSWVQSHFPGHFFKESKYNSWSETKAICATGDTLILAYCMGMEKLYVLAGCGQRDTAFAVVWDDSLQRAITTMQEALSDADGIPLFPGFTAPSWLLYRKLVLPALQICPKPGELPPRLIVAPDGQLGFIPFEALLTSAPQPGMRARQLPYLLKSSTVSYVPSLQMLIHLRRNRRADTQPGALGMGSDLQIEGQWGTLQPLQNASLEAKQAVEMMGGRALTDWDATESAFKQYSPEYGIVHVAAHGLLDPVTPLRSGILFHGGPNSPEDGLLHAYEVYQMSLSARLTVLSACSVGSGKWIRGQGVMSVGRSFMVAGCSNVVMTLQDVDDRMSYEIMKHYYEALSEGIPVAEALRAARLRYMEEADGEHCHPAYWSPFILMGEGETKLLPGNQGNPWIFAALGALLLIIAVAAFVLLGPIRHRKRLVSNQNLEA